MVGHDQHVAAAGGRRRRGRSRATPRMRSSRALHRLTSARWRRGIDERKHAAASSPTPSSICTHVRAAAVAAARAKPCVAARGSAAARSPEVGVPNVREIASRHDLAGSRAWFCAPREAILIEPSTDASPPVRSQSQLLRRCRRAARRGRRRRNRWDRRTAAALAAGIVMRLRRRRGCTSPRRPASRPARRRGSAICGERQPGALGEHASFVVVHRDVARLSIIASSSGPSKSGMPWPGSNTKGMPASRELRRRAIACRPCRRARRCRVRCRARPPTRALVRVRHRARMERRDLVVVEVGDDERLRRVRAWNVAHAVDVDARARPGAPVLAAVVADRRHHHRLAADAPSGCRRCCPRSRPTRGASRRR